jgi:signal peptidase I
MTPRLLLSVIIASMAMTAAVAIDAARRGRDPFGWAALVATTNLFGLILWLIVRRRSPGAVRSVGVLRSVGLVGATLPLIIIPVVMTVLGLAAAGFRVTRVNGRAMGPTINDQDRLLVNRLAYLRRAPERGDIVMLRYPLDPEKNFVKRVIAVAGDQVHIVAGHVFVNGTALEEPFIGEYARSRDDWGPQVVPDDHFFVLGDRRNNSSDSRHWGYVPRGFIVGRVYSRWWPVQEARRF